MIAAFAFAFVMSFWGSVPPGPCNITVLHTTLNYNSKAGIWVAFGSSVPELLYSFIALVAVHFVSAFVAIGFWLELSTAIILFVIGIYTVFFQKKTTSIDKKTQAESFQLHPFWKGALIALFNPMLAAFWLVTGQMGVSLGWVHADKTSDAIGFIVGTAVGAFALMLLVVFFTHKIKHYLTPTVILRLNKVVGLSFFFMALVQGVKSYLSYKQMSL